MEDSDYDYDEYFAKHLIDDADKDNEKDNINQKDIVKEKDVKFTNELDLIISSRNDEDDELTSRFSKSLKVSRSSKGKSLTNKSIQNKKTTKEITKNTIKKGNTASNDNFEDDYDNNLNNYLDDNGSENKKREINKKATLAAILERQKRLEKIKEKSKQKQKSHVLMNGIELLFNVIKLQNTKVLEDVKNEFKSCLPFNIDMEAEFIKPPYLTPKIVSHKLERFLNQT